jgi:hypothetical protein
MEKHKNIKDSCNNDTNNAFILFDKNKEPLKITIDQYLDNQLWIDKVSEGSYKLQCCNGHEVIKYKSEIKKSHFKHKVDLDNEMTQWHKKWQNEFKNNEVKLGNHRADTVENDMVIEFQHSKISKEDITSRTENCKKYNKQIIWVIECNNCIDISETIRETFLIIFRNDNWKYENFINTGNKYIYLDNNNKIYRVEPDKIKSHMLDVIEYKTRSNFIEDIKQNKFIWNETELHQGILYYNQRGAGCGKTYESIQLLEKNKEFADKTTFIYLTKMHSAKEVIYSEFKGQLENGQLETINVKEIIGDNNNGEKIKQYKIKYNNKTTGKECTIIIGTIDSFKYAIGDKKNKEKDYFEGIVKSIRDGYSDIKKNGELKYGGSNIKLNKNSLILIDEAQDLPPEYIESIATIIRNTYIDAYIIGDKLQSIWGENNIYTFLEKNELPNTKIIKSDGINKVNRFHNIQFKDLVNKIIDFKKYDLPEIENICTNKCNYKHENEITPYTIFQVPKLYSGLNDKAEDKTEKETKNKNEDKQYNKINEVIEKYIINTMEKEIEKYGYLPNNFTFIFPILSKNEFANKIYIRIQDFWIKKFNDKTYQENVLKKDKYWKDKINDDEFYEYVFLHKSDEGTSINLKESENATRIMSIHTSKGSGCEVVFLFGLSEDSLKIFSKQTNNLVFDSLLHVAITRQKKSLYMGIELNEDEIHNRFKKFDIIKDKDIEPSQKNIKRSNELKNVVQYVLSNQDKFDIVNNNIIIPNNYETLIPESKSEKNIIDMGHHLIRYYVFLYYIWYNIIKTNTIEETENKKFNQIIVVIKKIANYELKIFKYSDYYKKLQEITAYNNAKREKTDKEIELVIPILSFGTNEKSKYSKYQNDLNIFIKHIQKKIKDNLKNSLLPKLCPLEIIILMYMLNVMDNGSYTDVSILDVYKIMYYFDECSNEIDTDHLDNNCMCFDTFLDNNRSTDNTKYAEIRQSIKKHYEKTKEVDYMYNEYKTVISKYTDFLKIKYNIFHPITFKDRDDKNFKIWNKYRIIGNSDKHVIYFVVKPQFNKLNFSETIIEILFDNFFILNTSENTNNYERIAGKTIITCIFTLDSNKPIIYEFDVKKDNPILLDCYKAYLMDRYSKLHNNVYELYQFCKEQKDRKKSPIELLINKLESNNPKYISEYYLDIKSKYAYETDTKKKEEIKKLIDDKEVFLTEMKKLLEKKVDIYLGINQQKENDNNDEL